mmetsp:Transcript_11467/g.30392  ORF Transcript_11467/g.30392 Transcript_11467/m.30392 type:complete len:179 (-) Transcript_11467:621-1157(-)
MPNVLWEISAFGKNTKKGRINSRNKKNSHRENVNPNMWRKKGFFLFPCCVYQQRGSSFLWFPNCSVDGFHREMSTQPHERSNVNRNRKEKEERRKEKGEKEHKYKQKERKGKRKKETVSESDDCFHGGTCLWNGMMGTRKTSRLLPEITKKRERKKKKKEKEKEKEKQEKTTLKGNIY